MMQTDVKSAHLSAAGQMFNGRTRLRGFVVAPAVVDMQVLDTAIVAEADLSSFEQEG